MAALRDSPLFVYTLNQTTHWFIVGLTLPIMILYMTSRGLDLFQAGMVMSIYSATVIILELPTGGLSDAIGRKRVYMYSLTVSLLSGVTLILSDGLMLFLLGFSLYGVARALSSGSMDAWFVDEFKRVEPSGDLQKAVAKANVFIPLGIGAGSLLGGLLPMLTAGLSEGVAWMNQYTGNLVLMVLMVVVQMILTGALVRETAFQGDGVGLRDGFGNLPKVLSDAISYGIKDRFTLLLMIATFFMGFGLLSVELLWQPRTLSLMGDPGDTWVFGVLAAGYFFASAFGNLLATRLVTAFGNDHLKFLTMVRAVSGVALVVLALQQGLLEFALLYLLLYLIFGLANSPHVAVFNSRIPSDRRSTLMSFESLMLQGGGLLGSLLVGALAEASGIATAWTVSGAVLMASSGSYAVLYLKRRREGRAQERSSK